jgi:three-Cys-motif partner protein
MQVTWDTIKAVAKTQAIDLWYLFPLMAVNRLLKIDGKIPLPWRKSLDDMFGDSEWFNELYKPESQQELFGIDQAMVKDTNLRGIESYFIRRLKTAFPAVADNPVILVTPNGTSLFSLCFAVSNPSPKAVKLSMRIAQHILGKRKSFHGN